MKRSGLFGAGLLGGLVYGMSLVPLTAQPVLIWSDEFEEDGLPDPTKWRYDVGGGGWGNAEEQFYTEARTENARIESGILIIEGRKEDWPSSRNPENAYTSARLVSKGFGDWRYGRIDVRAKVPAGRGTWPAIWMLPTGNEYGGWPRSGEIDIMEHVGWDAGVIHGSLHSLENNWLTGTQPTGSTALPTATTAFHTYTVEWRPGSMRFLIDDAEYYAYTNPETGWEAWPFDQPFYLILNLAIGGFWGGQQGIDPDVWPERLEVEYVRVYDLGDTVPLDTDGDEDPNTTDPDDDGDMLSDAEEHAIGTNILKQDTDGDGYSDFEEVEAGTFPLLKGSFPGSDASILMINNDFEFGEDPWIIHTNRLNAEGGWIGQLGSWGGAYSIFDYVEPLGDGVLRFDSYTTLDAPLAEHLLYQEWNPLAIDLLPGDRIRFRGMARALSSSPLMNSIAFIRVLDFDFQPMSGTVEFEISQITMPFDLETILPEESINVLQVGLAITGPQWESANITFAGMEATINEQTSWAGWPIESGTVDTGGWMGQLSVGNAPWVWSHALGNWVYAPEAHIGPSGGWIFIPSAP